MTERTVRTLPGGIALLLALGLAGAAVVTFVAGLPPHVLRSAAAHQGQIAGVVVIGSLLGIGALAMLAGMFTISPNEARVMQFLGRYVGTTREEGWRWANPLYTRSAISLRMRNFETSRIKVNDVEGNPIEIGAIAVWRVVDSAQAMFAVEDYPSFVSVQAEAAVRNPAARIRGYHFQPAEGTGKTLLRPQDLDLFR